MSAFRPLDLAPWVNRRGFTSDAERRVGRFNAWGNSFPEEEAAFDTVRTVSEVPFVLSRRADGDHVEPSGQRIDARSEWPTRSIALLCCGEMGDREVEVRADLSSGAFEVLRFRAPGWLTDPVEPVAPEAWVFSHLHYPGDYELARLLPTLWLARRPLRSLSPLRELELRTNPFAHVFAVTLCRHA